MAENLGHVAENVGTDNVGTEELGHIKKTNSYKKTTSSKKTKPPLNFGRKIGAVRPENPDTLTGKSEQLGRKPVSDKPSYKPSYKPSMNRPNTRRAKTP